MLKAYVNYPNPKVTIHRDPSCQAIQKMAKQSQRSVRINPKTISTELKRFKAKGYAFTANAAGNDMWLEADFGDAAFEVAVVNYVHHLIGEHYAPLGKAIIGTHC